MFQKACAVLAIGLFTASCSSGAPDCSSDRVQDTVKRIAIKEISKQFTAIPVMTFLFNPETSQYKINGIRTIESNKKSCSCKATLHVDYELRDDAKKTRDTNPKEWEQLGGAQIIGVMQRAPDINITYHVERTDDGKEFYVTVEGL